jgi:hypothetical protein
MSVEVERATLACNVCGAQVTELRRGRCWGCYTRWAEARPVGRGAVCTLCHEKRRDQLKLIELHGRSLPMCHGCAARVGRLSSIPATIDGIRKALRRDRRDTDRRADKLDHRIFPRERRVGERREPRDARPDTDPHIHNPLEDIIIELEESELEEVEQTVVRGSKLKNTER